jgi:hypothetical protein
VVDRPKERYQRLGEDGIFVDREDKSYIAPGPQ